VTVVSLVPTACNLKAFLPRRSSAAVVQTKCLTTHRNPHLRYVANDVVKQRLLHHQESGRRPNGKSRYELERPLRFCKKRKIKFRNRPDLTALGCSCFCEMIWTAILQVGLICRPSLRMHRKVLGRVPERSAFLQVAIIRSAGAANGSSPAI